MSDAERIFDDLEATYYVTQTNGQRIGFGRVLEISGDWVLIEDRSWLPGQEPPPLPRRQWINVRFITHVEKSLL